MNIYIAPLDGNPGTAVVYALLEYAVNTKFNCGLPIIKKTPNGKPYFPERPDIQFSLSHGKTHVMCAISDKPTGVDIEAPRNISTRAIRFFCSPGELELFDPLDLWVLKESFIKLIGGTLPMMKKISVSYRDDREIAMRCNDDGAEPGELVRSRLYHIHGCHAAVSTTGDMPPETIEVKKDVVSAAKASLRNGF